MMSERGVTKRYINGALDDSEDLNDPKFFGWLSAPWLFLFRVRTGTRLINVDSEETPVGVTNSKRKLEVLVLISASNGVLER